MTDRHDPKRRSEVRGGPKNQVLRKILFLLILTLLFGCQGSHTYKSDVAAFQTSLKAVTDEVALAALEANKSLREEYYSKARFGIEIKKPSDLHEEPSTPSVDEVLTRAEEREFVEAIAALSQFSKHLGDLAEVEGAKEINTAELDSLAGLLERSGKTLKEFDHHAVFAADGPNLDHLGTRLVSLSKVISEFGKAIAQKKRAEAIKAGVKKGMPILEETIPCLYEILIDLRKIQRDSLVNRRDTIADNVNRMALEEEEREEAKAALSDAINALAGKLNSNERAKMSIAVDKVVDLIPSRYSYSDQELIKGQVNELNQQIKALKESKRPQKITIDLIKATLRLSKAAGRDDIPKFLQDAIDIDKAGGDINLNCLPPKTTWMTVR